jgi:hypothetical protein
MGIDNQAASFHSMVCHAQERPVESGGMLCTESVPCRLPFLIDHRGKLKAFENVAFDAIDKDAERVVFKQTSLSESWLAEAFTQSSIDPRGMKKSSSRPLFSALV